MKRTNANYLRIFSAAIFFALVLYIPKQVNAQDADGDGMPDAWENTYTCMMANTVDGGDDPDGDGMTSLVV